MSLGVVFKSPEGVVLATDSRVTLFAEQTLPDAAKVRVLPSTFDNATKLLELKRHPFVGVVTYGLGALGTASPRTAHSFTPELENELDEANDRDELSRLQVAEYAQKMSDFFMNQWDLQGMPAKDEYQLTGGDPMTFLVAGYDEDEPYGRVYEFNIPHQPKPIERNADSFGLIWGGQGAIVSRLIHGADPNLARALAQETARKTGIDLPDAEQLVSSARQLQHLPIPYQFLSLQDSVDLASLLVRTTMELQRFQVGVRGVGGAIDVATITRTDGLVHINRKNVSYKLS